MLSPGVAPEDVDRMSPNGKVDSVTRSSCLTFFRPASMQIIRRSYGIVLARVRVRVRVRVIVIVRVRVIVIVMVIVRVIVRVIVIVRVWVRARFMAGVRVRVFG